MDETTLRLLNFLHEKTGEEPERPDLERHTGSLLEEVASQHYQWQRQIDGLRLLIGVRLTDWALESTFGAS